MQKLAALNQQTGHPAAHVNPDRRAVIVTGVRTPFTRAFSEQLNVDTIALSTIAVKGLIDKTKIDPAAIDHVAWGGVILQNGAPNTARELIIDAKLPPHISAHTETMACASGLKAVLSAVQMIESNNGDVIIAGGSDSTSTSEMSMARNVTQSLAMYSYGKIGVGKLLSVAGLPCSWMPKAPQVAERSTGKSMGYHADVMAGLCGATREAQDELAMRSHINASAAAKKGLFADEIITVNAIASPLLNAKTITKDTMIRAKQDPAKMKVLKPVFRSGKAGGTITAATASPLTDGAAACLVMSAGMARKLGYTADVAVRSWAMSGIAPEPNLLLAPALAIPVALRRAGLTMADIDFFEIHEAFAGQVLATINVLASKELCAKYLNLNDAVGAVPSEKLNIYGGSVSIGHPFGATGARLTTNATRILRQNPGSKYVLVSICAAGGLGLVTIFERI
jgi:acetyl-CoA acyltransferase